jgi:hypothetical protein
MLKLIKSRRLVALVGVVAVLAAAGAAVAYFTSTGTGSATATVGTSSALTVNGTPSGSLYPGASATVNFTASNPSPGHEYLATIHLASLTVDSSHATAGCSATWFSMPDVTANQDIPSGTGAGSTTVTATGSLSMSNSGNQDACQGATLTLNFTTT